MQEYWNLLIKSFETATHEHQDITIDISNPTNEYSIAVINGIISFCSIIDDKIKIMIGETELLIEKNNFTDINYEIDCFVDGGEFELKSDSYSIYISFN